MPFTVREFLDVFRSYNQAVYPAQVILIILGGIAVLSLFIRWKYRDRLIAGILALLWMWAGVMYHISFFSRINPAGPIFGTMFIIQAVLLIIYGIIQRKMIFFPRMNLRTMIGLGILLYAMLLYPVIGSISGHSYPHLPTFGVPCPVTIYTFGMLFMLQAPLAAAVFIIPLIWSVIGGSAAVFLGIPEDTGLIVSGIGALVLLIRYFVGLRTPGGSASGSQNTVIGGEGRE